MSNVSNQRSGFKGNKVRTHNRLKSAAPGGRNLQEANSVADFVKASADPRGGIWAKKAYKTPHTFVSNFYRPHTFCPKQPKINCIE